MPHVSTGKKETEREKGKRKGGKKERKREKKEERKGREQKRAETLRTYLTIELVSCCCITNHPEIRRVKTTIIYYGSWVMKMGSSPRSL